MKLLFRTFGVIKLFLSFCTVVLAQQSDAQLAIRQGIESALANKEIQLESSYFRIPVDSVILWNLPVTIGVHDLTDRSLTSKIPYPFQSPIEYIRASSGVDLRIASNPAVRIILSDNLVNMPVPSRIEQLELQVGLNHSSAEQVATDLSASKICYFKRFLSPQGQLTQGLIFIQPSKLQVPPVNPGAVIECIYEGIISILGFPRSAEIKLHFGKRSGLFDTTALKSLYACKRYLSNKILYSSLTCVLNEFPEGVAKELSAGSVE